MKKWITVLACLLVMACTGVCFAADSFQTIYEAQNFTNDMKNDQAFTETFSTPYGKLKFQIRKLWTTSNDRRMHLIAWLNDKKIADEYYPKVDYGYTFRVIKNISNSELFYVVQSIERAYLYGYFPKAQKMVTYIDSQNYAHPTGTYPYIVALKNGDLILAFENNRSRPIRSRYKFSWDSSKNWFGYSDLGTGWNSIAYGK